MSSSSAAQGLSQQLSQQTTKDTAVESVDVTNNVTEPGSDSPAGKSDTASRPGLTLANEVSIVTAIVTGTAAGDDDAGMTPCSGTSMVL